MTGWPESRSAASAHRCTNGNGCSFVSVDLGRTEQSRRAAGHDPARGVGSGQARSVSGERCCLGPTGPATLFCC